MFAAALACDVAPGFAFSFVGLFQDANVEPEEFSCQEVLNDFVIVEQRFPLKTNAAFHFAIFTFWYLPVLLKKNLMSKM